MCLPAGLLHSLVSGSLNKNTPYMRLNSCGGILSSPISRGLKVSQANTHGWQNVADLTTFMDGYNSHRLGDLKAQENCLLQKIKEPDRKMKA